jgi:nitrite reductase/ring-hydroxylating ferredoxin subunit
MTTTIASHAGQLELPTAWWPVAFSAEVNQHPTAFVLGARRLALYRDRGGTVRAVDDICPHRRMPLSLGRVTEDGYLQCAYHGWCFDGATGACAAIPHLRDDEPVKPNLRVAAFATVEGVADAFGASMRTGLAPAVNPEAGDEVLEQGMTMLAARITADVVRVWNGEDAPPTETTAATATPSSRRCFSSSMKIRAPYDLIAEVLLRNPGQMLGLQLLLGASTELIRPQVTVDRDTIIVRRERLTLSLPRPQTFTEFNHNSTTIEINTNVVTGFTSITAEAAEQRRGAIVTVALTPISPILTIVRWRAEVNADRKGRLEQASSLHRFSARAVRAVHALVDESSRS